MKIVAITHKENKVYFKSPYNVDGTHLLDYKYSDLLNLTLVKGNQIINTVGEISYLPHFHQHSYQDILDSLNFLKQKLPIDLISLKNIEMPSSLRFAIEGALFKLKNPLNDTIKTNALFTLGQDETNAFLSPVVKIKIARDSIQEEVSAIKNLMAKYPTHLFRLDANRKLNPETIKPYLELDLSKVDYFEEPFTELKDYKQLSSFPFALDENVSDFFVQKNNFSNLRALVFKPSCYGVNETINFINLINKKNIKTIFSSTFESSIGLEIIKAMAGKYAPSDYHGLDTLNFLELNK